jgi:hypothetical protein
MGNWTRGVPSLVSRLLRCSWSFPDQQCLWVIMVRLCCTPSPAPLWQLLDSIASARRLLLYFYYPLTSIRATPFMIASAKFLAEVFQQKFGVDLLHLQVSPTVSNQFTLQKTVTTIFIKSVAYSGSCRGHCCDFLSSSSVQGCFEPPST